jgi:cell division protease FtsH
MNSVIKTLVLWLAIVVIIIVVFSNYGPKQASVDKIAYSQFIQEVEQNNIKSVTIETNSINAVKKDDTKVNTFMPLADQNLLPKLMQKGIDVRGNPPDQPGILTHIFINWFPIFLLIGGMLFIMRQLQGGGGGKGGPFSFGRSRARLLNQDQVKITFADVAGVEEAKEEVGELVDFLKDPKKFQKLGGKVPCGVLLLGAPGTGKTLLAKAVAGEAKVPFYSISGSDFVEMFVGVGAARVRDLFETAKKHAPCIIFIDEIDAVGRHRGAGLGGGHDEREQTLNQLLVEMDGFAGKEGVIVVAATNRPDVLDPALLRPGRFDRQVVVPLPDIRGREQILRVHMRKVPAAKDVDPAIFARSTPGLSGADLANLVNEAALFAARANKKHVEMIDFEKAKDKILMGSERRSMVISEEEKRTTAYHEAGHAIVGLSLAEFGYDPIYKVTIIPRGRALGVTMFLPEQDYHNYSKQKLESQISGLLGGRVAEVIKFGADLMNTGAANDIERATTLARNMVTRWGLSEKLGPMVYGSEEGEIFLGRSVTAHKEISDATAAEIDHEIRSIIDRNYQRAEKILQEHLPQLEMMADFLIKNETIDKKQIEAIMKGRRPRSQRSNDVSDKKDQQGIGKELLPEQVTDKGKETSRSNKSSLDNSKNKA